MTNRRLVTYTQTLLGHNMNDERTIYMLTAGMLAVYVVLYIISRQ